MGFLLMKNEFSTYVSKLCTATCIVQENAKLQKEVKYRITYMKDYMVKIEAGLADDAKLQAEMKERRRVEEEERMWREQEVIFDVLPFQHFFDSLGSKLQSFTTLLVLHLGAKVVNRALCLMHISCHESFMKFICKPFFRMQGGLKRISGRRKRRRRRRGSRETLPPPPARMTLRGRGGRRHQRSEVQPLKAQMRKMEKAEGREIQERAWRKMFSEWLPR